MGPAWSAAGPLHTYYGTFFRGFMGHPRVQMSGSLTLVLLPGHLYFCWFVLFKFSGTVFVTYDNFHLVIFYDYLLVSCTFLVRDRKGVDLDAWEVGRNPEEQTGKL